MFGWRSACLAIAVGLAAGPAPRADEALGKTPAPEAAIENSLGMRFVWVPAGELWMGSQVGDPDERPVHRVTISPGLWLAAYEVTRGEYQAVMDEDPSWNPLPGGTGSVEDGADRQRLPVDRVAWTSAVGFCRRLAELPAEELRGRHYRLPSEAEWEFACRAGGTTQFHWGDDPDVARANFAPSISHDAALGAGSAASSGGSVRPVGSYPPNPLGLYDMHGNVWEWCADHYAPGWYKDSPRDMPHGPLSGTGRVVRGGDYRFPATFARSANRDFTRATRRDRGNGLRVVLEIREPAP